MVSKMFSVFDCKVGAYLQPFFMRSKGEAIRAFMGACRDPQSQFHSNPGDFTLFEIGEYDDVSAVVIQDKPLNLGSALEFRSREEATGMVAGEESELQRPRNKKIVNEHFNKKEV